MRRRRKLVYRGTPEEHRRTARALAGQARKALGEARRAIARGDCPRALSALLSASGRKGATDAEASWVGRWARQGSASRALRGAAARFAKRCMR